MKGNEVFGTYLVSTTITLYMGGSLRHFLVSLKMEKSTLCRLNVVNNSSLLWLRTVYIKTVEHQCM